MPGIAAAISPFALSMEIIRPIGLLGPIALLELVEDALALCINIRRDVMGHLTGGMAKADAPVKSCRAQPEGTIVFLLVRAPESYDDAVAAGYRRPLLECEVLLASEQEEAADGSLIIRTPKN